MNPIAYFKKLKKDKEEAKRLLKLAEQDMRTEVRFNEKYVAQKLNNGLWLLWNKATGKGVDITTSSYFEWDEPHRLRTSCTGTLEDVTKRAQEFAINPFDYKKYTKEEKLDYVAALNFKEKKVGLTEEQKKIRDQIVIDLL